MWTWAILHSFFIVANRLLWLCFSQLYISFFALIPPPQPAVETLYEVVNDRLFPLLLSCSHVIQIKPADWEVNHRYEDTRKNAGKFSIIDVFLNNPQHYRVWSSVVATYWEQSVKRALSLRLSLVMFWLQRKDIPHFLKPHPAQLSAEDRGEQHHRADTPGEKTLGWKKTDTPHSSGVAGHMTRCWTSSR